MLHNTTTIQGTNISHLRKRKINFNYACCGDMLVPWRVFIYNDKHLSHLSDGLLGPTLQEVGWSKVESQIWLGQPWPRMQHILTLPARNSLCRPTTCCEGMAHSRQPVLATWFCGFSGPGVYSRRNVNLSLALLQKTG